MCYFINVVIKNSKEVGKMRLKKAALGLVMVCLVFSLLFSSGITVKASTAEDGTPVGTVIAFAGGIAPEGYLLCDGTAYSRITYQRLYMVIGTVYGAGDGATFNVPDLRGEFIRGLDNGRGVDTGRALGSWQEDMFKKHSHGANYLSYSVSGEYARKQGYRGWASQTDETGGSETRPRNVALNYCIKY
jgi:phage-related tail fiber protein